MKHSISSKIQNAVLRGRAVLERRQPAKAETLSPEQSRANLLKFRDLLDKLASSRDDLDAAQKISDEAQAKPEDLTARFLETGTLPKPGSLADDADAGKLLTSVVKSALDRLAADASRSIVVLQGVKNQNLAGLEKEVLSQIEKPLWMRAEDFAVAVAGCPAFVALGNLARVSPPLLPLIVLADETPLLPGERYKPTTIGLGQYRTRPLTAWERKRTLGSDDAFDPHHIAGWITRWLAHLDAVQSTTSEDLMNC